MAIPELQRPRDHPWAQLSIWRDFALTPPLALQDEQGSWRVITRDSGVQQEVYSWPLSLDPFDCIENGNVRMSLREALLDRLDVSLSPRKRGVTVLREFVAKAERVIEAGQAGPLPSTSTSTASAGYTTYVPSEPNPLLALTQHLNWIIRCFEGRPGVSVSVR